MPTILIIFVRINWLNSTKIAPIIQWMTGALVVKMSTPKKVRRAKHRALYFKKLGGNVPLPPTDLRSRSDYKQRVSNMYRFSCAFLSVAASEIFTSSRTVLTRSSASTNVHDHPMRRVFGLREHVYSWKFVARLRNNCRRATDTLLNQAWCHCQYWRGLCTMDVTARRLLSLNNSRPRAVMIIGCVAASSAVILILLSVLMIQQCCLHVNVVVFLLNMLQCDVNVCVCVFECVRAGSCVNAVIIAKCHLQARITAFYFTVKWCCATL